MIEWLNRRYRTTFSNDDLEEIKNFALIWNVFEGKYFSTRFTIPDAENILSGRSIDAGQFDEYLHYFRNRYTDGGLVNGRFPFLNFRASNRKTMVRDVLLGSNTNNNDVILALIIIVYRYRNNLFHGIKEFEHMNEQVANFQCANRFLMLLMDNLPF